MILCDTNILIEFYKNNQQIVQELRHIGQNQLAISPVTQTELYFGALNKAESGKIKQHLSLTSQSSRPPTAAIFNGSAPAKSLLIGTCRAGTAAAYLPGVSPQNSLEI